jgi:hypothetical protein
MLRRTSAESLSSMDPDSIEDRQSSESFRERPASSRRRRTQEQVAGQGGDTLAPVSLPPTQQSPVRSPVLPHGRPLPRRLVLGATPLPHGVRPSCRAGGRGGWASVRALLGDARGLPSASCVFQAPERAANTGKPYSRTRETELPREAIFI